MIWELRPWKPSDAPSIARYADNPKIAEKLRNVFPHPYSLADAEHYIRSCIEADESRQLSRAIIVDSHAAGSIAAVLGNDVYCKSVELGYWLAEPYWGQGIMTQVIRRTCADVFNRYDVVRIYAEPFAHNAASRRVLEKAGFHLEGVLERSVFKNGAFGDTCVYALLR